MLVAVVIHLMGVVSIAKNGTYDIRLHANLTYAQGLVGAVEKNSSSKVKNLTLDYYEPLLTPAAGLKPAMVVIHGGAYWTGDKRDDVIVRVRRSQPFKLAMLQQLTFLSLQ